MKFKNGDILRTLQIVLAAGIVIWFVFWAGRLF